MCITEKNGRKLINWQRLDEKITNDEDLSHEEKNLANKLICPVCKSSGTEGLMIFVKTISAEESLFECDICKSRRKLKNYM